MAGTTALEPAASAVTVNDIEEHGRHRKSLEVHHRQRYCVSPCVSRTLLPLGKEAEKNGQKAFQQNFGSVAPGVVQYTTDVLFRDLWLHPELAPRDRSLVTAGLDASDQAA
jgi:alkylhydroperoxidase/carboxymuconolactone decarboxylase family protein YurZ